MHHPRYIGAEDEIQEKPYDWALVKRLFRYIKPYTWRVGVSVTLLLTLAGLGLLGPYLTKRAIDVHIAAGDRAGLRDIALLFLAIQLMRFLLRYVEVYITRMTGQKVMYDLRMKIFSHLHQLSLSFFDRNPVGRLMTRVTNDVQVLNETLTSGLVSLFGDVFTLLGIMVAMLVMNAKLALVTFSVIPLIFCATAIFRIKVRKAYREIRQRVAQLNTYLQENIVGTEVVQLFNREELNFARFDEINQYHLRAHLRSITYYALFFPTVEWFSFLAIAAILSYGGIQITHSALSFGVIVAFIQYVQRFFHPIRSLAEKFNILQAAMASSERIFGLLDTKPDIESPPTPVPVESTRGDIEFRHVWFAYQGDNYVLRDVSFRVPAGSSVALVGATGAGKSTIINLLCRFYEVSKGQILIDGVDIREMDVYQLRRQIGVVLQDVFLFTGDIESNIRLGEEAISSEQVQDAARYVNADRFIRQLPDGYQEEVKERGSTLSVGEKQLLAFARALAFSPKILVLDEATSSIDTETELLIQDAVGKLMEGRTSVVIAHRLSTIQHADNIIVLHKGEVREMGDHQTLLAQSGIYYKLFQLQYKDQRLDYAERPGVILSVRNT